jgi:hypothetical protein
MIAAIVRTPTFEKSLEALRKAGGLGPEVADHAEGIIARLVDEGGAQPGEAGRLTRYGENRVKNCLKFDLKYGFRLVCMKEEDRLFLLFIGAHEEVDRWARNSRGKVLFREENVVEIPVAFEIDEEEDPEEPEPEDESDLFLAETIDDSILREIFKGLCGGAGA